MPIYPHALHRITAPREEAGWFCAKCGQRWPQEEKPSLVGCSERS